MGLSTVKELVDFTAEAIRCVGENNNLQLTEDGCDYVPTVGSGNSGGREAAKELVKSYVALGVSLMVFPQPESLDGSRLFLAVEHTLRAFQSGGRFDVFRRIVAPDEISSRATNIGTFLVKELAQQLRRTGLMDGAWERILEVGDFDVSVEELEAG